MKKKIIKANNIAKKIKNKSNNKPDKESQKEIDRLNKALNLSYALNKKKDKKIKILETQKAQLQNNRSAERFEKIHLNDQKNKTKNKVVNKLKTTLKKHNRTDEFKTKNQKFSKQNKRKNKQFNKLKSFINKGITKIKQSFIDLFKSLISVNFIGFVILFGLIYFGSPDFKTFIDKGVDNVKIFVIEKAKYLYNKSKDFYEYIIKKSKYLLSFLLSAYVVNLLIPLLKYLSNNKTIINIPSFKATGPKTSNYNNDNNNNENNNVHNDNNSNNNNSKNNNIQTNNEEIKSLKEKNNELQNKLNNIDSRYKKILNEKVEGSKKVWKEYYKNLNEDRLKKADELEKENTNLKLKFQLLQTKIKQAVNEKDEAKRIAQLTLLDSALGRVDKGFKKIFGDSIWQNVSDNFLKMIGFGVVSSTAISQGPSVDISSIIVS